MMAYIAWLNSESHPLKIDDINITKKGESQGLMITHHSCCHKYTLEMTLQASKYPHFLQLLAIE